MSGAVPLPWQQSQWQRLQSLRQNQRLPHALLLAGPAGVGKRQFADALANSLLCLNPETDGLACGHCRGCNLLAAGSHPDRLKVAPEGNSRQIKVDAVRDILDFTAQTSQQGGYKVVVLSPAEAMNRNAANALLKCLEEPAGASVLILLSDQPGLLPATIRSRCQQIAFPVPPEAESLAWLAALSDSEDVLATALTEAGGRPLSARALLDSEQRAQRQAWREQLLALVEGRAHAISVAAVWQDTPLEEVLVWLEARLAEAVRQALVPQREADPLTQALARRGAQALLAWSDRLTEARAQLAAGANFSRPLVLEALLL